MFCFVFHIVPEVPVFPTSGGLVIIVLPRLENVVLKRDSVPGNRLSKSRLGHRIAVLADRDKPWLEIECVWIFCNKKDQ